MYKFFIFSIFIIFSFQDSLAHQKLFKQKLSDEQEKCLNQEREKCWSLENLLSKSQKKCVRKCHNKAKGWKKSKMECKKKCNLPKLTEEEKSQRKLCKKQIHQACGVKKIKNNLSQEQKQCIKKSRKECFEKYAFFTDEQKICISQCKKLFKSDNSKNMSLNKKGDYHKIKGYSKEFKEHCRKQCNLPELAEEQKTQKKQCRNQAYKYCNIINK